MYTNTVLCSQVVPENLGVQSQMEELQRPMHFPPLKQELGLQFVPVKSHPGDRFAESSGLEKSVILSLTIMFLMQPTNAVKPRVV